MTSISDVVRAIDDRRKQDLEEMQQVAIELSTAIASRLVHEKIEAGELNVEKLVETAILALEPNQPLSVRLHPEDLAALKKKLQGRPVPWSHEANIQLAADASMKRGDCSVEGEQFGVISRLQDRLSDIREFLLKSLHDAQVERRKTMPGSSRLQRYPDRRETA